jgi:MscS family membrane protein
MNNIIYILENNGLIYHTTMIIVYLIVTLGLIKIVNLVLDKLQKKFKNSERIINLAILSVISRPLHTFIWIMCLYKVIKLTNYSITILYKIMIISVTFIALSLFFRFIAEYTRLLVEKKEKNKENIDYIGIDFIKKLSQVTVFLIITLNCLGKIGVSFQSLVAISGASGIVIGFAAKDLLLNVFATLTVYMDKTFTVGDWISSPDKEIEGTVEEIGWRQTKIITSAMYPIYVPNSAFMDIIVQNKGKMKSRVISEIIPIRYIDFSKSDKIVKEIKEMIKDHNSINQRLTTVIALDSVSNGLTLNLKLYLFANVVEFTRYMEIKHDILTKTVKIIQDNGGELGYNVNLFNLLK